MEKDPTLFLTVMRSPVRDKPICKDRTGDMGHMAPLPLLATQRVRYRERAPRPGKGREGVPPITSWGGHLARNRNRSRVSGGWSLAEGPVRFRNGVSW